MTPEQRLIAKWIFVLLLFLGTFFGGFYVRGYIAEHEQTEAQLALAESTNKTLGEYLDKVDERDAQIAQLQEEAAARDFAHTKALYEKEAANTALAHDLAVAERMRFTGGVCPKPKPAGPSTAAAGSVGDAADHGGVELSAEGRQDVFHLRSGILTNEAKVTYLQDYSNGLLKWISKQRWCPQ